MKPGGWVRGGCQENLLSPSGRLERETRPFQGLHHLTPGYFSRPSSCIPCLLLKGLEQTSPHTLCRPLCLACLDPCLDLSKATFEAKILFPVYSPVEASLLHLFFFFFCPCRRPSPSSFFFFLSFFPYAYPWHMEVPRLGVESEP